MARNGATQVCHAIKKKVECRLFENIIEMIIANIKDMSTNTPDDRIFDNINSDVQVYFPTVVDKLVFWRLRSSP